MARGTGLRGILLLACVASLLIAACGGGGSSSSTSTGSDEGVQEVSAKQSSKEFLEPKNKKSEANSIANFGKEASLEEREEANAVIQRSYDARAAADFETQCETLERAAVKQLESAEAKGKKPPTCAEAVRKLAEPLAKTKDLRKNDIAGAVAALRVKGSKAYALYHGTDGKNYALTLKKEDGNWLLTALVSVQVGG